MKKLIVLLACLSLILFAGTAGALTIDFDDVPNLIAQGSGIDHYTFETFDTVAGTTSGTIGDFVFTNWAFMPDDSYVNNYGNEYGAPTPEFALFNYYGNGSGVGELSISSERDFVFEGAYFSAFGGPVIPTPASSITITGWLNGVQVVDPVEMTLTSEYQYLATTWNQYVDTLEFTYTSSGEKGWFLMDHFVDSIRPLPEPATLLLIGAGLLGIGLARRKFNI